MGLEENWLNISLKDVKSLFRLIDVDKSGAISERVRFQFWGGKHKSTISDWAGLQFLTENTRTYKESKSFTKFLCRRQEWVSSSWKNDLVFRMWVLSIRTRLYHNIPNKVNISQLWNIQTLCIEFLEKTFARFSIELIFHWQTLPGITYRVPQVTPVYFALFKIKMPTQKMLMLLLMLKGVLRQLVWL